MRLIDADELYYEDVECTDGNTYSVVHAPTIDNADVFDLEAHDSKLLDKVYTELEQYKREINLANTPWNFIELVFSKMKAEENQ